jgi:heme iron utilization protein
MPDDARQSSLIKARNAFMTARTGTLAVIDIDSGGPLAAFVNVAMLPDATPVILTSRLSRHTQCLDKDGRASLMVTGNIPTQGDALTGLRASLTGTFIRNTDTGIREAYIAHHPYAELYADFSDFGFFTMKMDKLYVVAGFGRVYNFDADDLVAATT